MAAQSFEASQDSQREKKAAPHENTDSAGKMEASMFTKRLAARRVQIFSDFTIKVQNTKKIYINQTIEYDKQMRILKI